MHLVKVEAQELVCVVLYSWNEQATGPHFLHKDGRVDVSRLLQPLLDHYGCGGFGELAAALQVQVFFVGVSEEVV